MTLKENEFDAELENHDIYRLYYINYHIMGRPKSIFSFGKNIGLINWPFKPFMLPNGMSREEGFKVLSYLANYIEKNKDIEPASLKSVKILDGVLDLERLGFKRVEEKDEDKIINLFTVGGRFYLFKKSELYKKYFEWYTEDVSLEEVKRIYSNCGIDFYDLVPKVKNDSNEAKLIR